MRNKTYNQKTFKLSDSVYIDCETYETRYSWGHKAYLYVDDRQEAYKKITYYNRTWESYCYQSIIHGIIEGTPDKILKDKQKLKQVADAIGSGNVKRELGSIAMIAKMGELLTDTQSQANDWKARMLKAGLGEGLSMPDDWGALSEDEKQARLDKAIQTIA